MTPVSVTMFVMKNQTDINSVDVHCLFIESTHLNHQAHLLCANTRSETQSQKSAAHLWNLLAAIWLNFEVANPSSAKFLFDLSSNLGTVNNQTMYRVHNISTSSMDLMQ